MNKKPLSWYAQRYSDKYGMAVIPVKHKSKLPLENDWGNRAMQDPAIAEQYFQQHQDLNIGLALGPSAFCSFDIDCLRSLQIIADEFGIDLKESLGGVPTIQGSGDGMRCLFRVPASSDLMKYHKLNWPSELDPTGDIHKGMMRDAAKAKADGDLEREADIRERARAFSKYTVFELRISTSGKQLYDVLPPSIHPDTQKPYKWIVQPAKSLEEWPEIPHWLLSIWQVWDKFKPQLEEACPWLPAKAEQAPLPQPMEQRYSEGINVIDAYIAATPLIPQLERYGYTAKGSKRYLSPHSGTKLPGVIIMPDGNRCYIHHASDPLCGDDRNNQPVNSFDLYCEYDHNGDIKEAVKAAAKELGIKSERKRSTEAKSMNTLPATPAELSSEPVEAVAPERYRPFRSLGYNANSFYYLSRGTEQVTEIKRGSHTSPAELMSLAPIEWWETSYPKEKGGADWLLAANDCMRNCERAGIYSAERERGRGAWYDEGKAVLHLGNRLLVDGEQMLISDHASKFIYTRQAPLEHGADSQPADDVIAAKALEIFYGLNWQKPVHAEMLAGWCLLAPICGALSWRPHVWITAQRGAGKSWIQDHIIEPLLGPAAMMVQGSTTEAGIRQRLKSDSRPIVFDEAESEDQRSANRMQTVIELARQSSSDSTAEIVKGTVNGHGMSFRMRSMFLLGSINVSLSQAADESRFSVLSLATPEKTKAEIERFDVFSKLVDNTLTAEYCAAIRARAYRLMPVIRHNASTFARAIAEELGSQRIGDQIGTLLAGAHAYKSSLEVTLDEARLLVKGMDFSDAKESEQVSDEEACLQRILQSQVRFDSEIGNIQRSLGEVIDIASGREYQHGIMAKDANDVLKRYGIAVDGSVLVVANNHAELEKLLRDTPWAAGWRRILARIEGASSTPSPFRFAGTVSRSVQIPINFIQ